MKVSVLMTLYNKGPWVREAVESVLGQTFTDFELLVVDDASTDDGLARVKAIGDPRIRIIESAENTGRAAAANRGYDAARGAYVAVLDADDLMHPERLAKQVAFLDAHPEVGAVGSWSEVVGQPDRVIRVPEDDAGCRGIMYFGMPVLYPACMLRRSVLEEHGLRCDPEWLLPGMDRLFMLRIGRHTRYANLQQPLSSYRIGANNMRHGRSPADYRLPLERAIADVLGVPISEEELRLHVAFYRVLAGPYDAARVKRLWAWKQVLIARNAQLGLFTPGPFKAQLEHRWSRVFHLLADQGLGAGWMHLRLSGTWSLAQLGYLAKVTLRRWLGKPLDNNDGPVEATAYDDR